MGVQSDLIYQANAWYTLFTVHVLFPTVQHKDIRTSTPQTKQCSLTSSTCSAVLKDMEFMNSFIEPVPLGKSCLMLSVID